jgi:hypothetical protein
MTSEEKNLYKKKIQFASAAFSIGQNNNLPEQFQKDLYDISLLLIRHSANSKNFSSALSQFMDICAVLVTIGALSKESSHLLQDEYQSFISTLPRTIDDVFSDTFSGVNGTPVLSSGNKTNRKPNKTTRHRGKKNTSDRSEKILQFLRDNGQSSISEVAGAFPDDSNKTVQRELGSLVDEGKVVKEGERRWSRYKLVR